MSEPMTTELIVEAEWRLKGYWTKLRVPVKVENGWSDIDVLAYCPESEHLVIAESKAEGPKNVIYAGENSNYWSRLTSRLPEYYKDSVIFPNCRKNCRKSVKKLTVQLVSNWVPHPCRSKVIAKAQDEVKEVVDVRNVEVMLDTVIDVLARVLDRERDTGIGRRYGHPILDLARELNRYLYPSIHGAGRSKSTIDEVKTSVIQPLLRALRAE